MPTGAVELSESQKRAVAHDAGCLRIVACPGSGKTETVSRRVAELVSKGADPSKIVAFTFTRKAADSLKARIRRMLGERTDIGGMYAGTIDAFCLYMLKKIKPEYRAFEVLDGAKRAAFLSRWYRKIELDRFDNGGGKWRVIEDFGRSVDIAVTEKIDMSRVDPNFAWCYEAYAARLREERFFDFVGVISALVKALQDGPADLERIGGEVKHVVFDEYQDVNKIQEKLLELLSRNADSVCVVGDDDQNIFQWRGSDIGHIREFPSKYAEYGVTTEELGTNYRATGALISLAGRFIARNKSRIKKDMAVHAGQPNKFEQGDIFHRHFDTDSEELGFVCDSVENLRGAGFAGRDGGMRPLAYRDMAILVRTNKDASKAAEFLSRRGIPCVTDSGADIFGRPVVSLALDCVMYCFGDEFEPAELAGRYAEAVPKGETRSFEAKLARIKAMADEISAKEKGWLPGLGLQEFYHRVLNVMGAEDGALSDSDMYGLAVLSKAVSDYEYVYRFMFSSQVRGLRGFIENVPDYEDPERADPGRLDAVRVMTIWKAKGLEFPVVFVTAFDNRKRPPPERVFIDDSLYESGRYKGGEEDDRRAYYTAVTRSQKYLFLTSASTVKSDSKKSRGPHPFVDEMRGPEVSADGPGRRPGADAASSGAVRDGLLKSSYKEIASYDRCPYEYQIRHVMGFNPGVPIVFGYGTNIHNILSYLHDRFARGDGMPDEQAIRRAFDEMFYLRFAPTKRIEVLKESGISKVAKYVRLHGADFARIRDTEKRFELDIGGAMISGSIDLVRNARDGGVEIVDFKTGKDKSGYESDYEAQIRLYAHAARAALDYEPEKATIYNLDADVKSVDIGGDVLDKTASWIREKISMIASERFEPAPSRKKCEECDFRALCPHKGFELGPRFGTNYDVKPPAATPDDDPPVTSGESIKSKTMRTKAEKLAASVVGNSDGTFSVPSSSEPGKSYSISAGMECGCRGFKGYSERHPGTPPTCSHVEAVKAFLRHAGNSR